MVDPSLQLMIRHVTLEPYPVPMSFVHVKSRLHTSILLPKPQRLFRVALQADTASLSIGGYQGKHPAHHLHHDGHLIEWGCGFSILHRETIIKQFFNIHTYYSSFAQPFGCMLLYIVSCRAHQKAINASSICSSSQRSPFHRMAMISNRAGRSILSLRRY